MIVKLVNNKSLLEWFNWLTTQGLVIGQDFHWAWKDDCMAVEFKDPHNEVIFLLKQYHNDC